MVEKEFDLVKVLEDTSKQIEADSFKMTGRRDGYEDAIKFIKENKLKITKFEEEPVEDTKGTNVEENKK